MFQKIPGFTVYLHAPLQISSYNNLTIRLGAGVFAPPPWNMFRIWFFRLIQSLDVLPIKVQQEEVLCSDKMQWWWW